MWMLYGEPKIPESQDISAKARGGQYSLYKDLISNITGY